MHLLCTFHCRSSLHPLSNNLSQQKPRFHLHLIPIRGDDQAFKLIYLDENINKSSQILGSSGVYLK